MADNTDTSSIFLTVAQAVRAICIDFRQYAPQTLLFAGILPLISNNTMCLDREAGQNGAWVNRAGQHNMQWLEGPELIEFMCAAITNAHWNPVLAASVCSRVFQTRAVPVVSDGTRDGGVWVETGMETFSCRQCGNCCRTLNYHNELTQADISLWRSQQRRDILRWVDVVSQEGSGEKYRIWVSPKTGRIADICPFLDKSPTSNIWQCRIQDVKPGICRQYPTSRKHALMTGCLGFTSDK